MLGVTMKAIVSEWPSLVNCKNSVANMAGVPPATDPLSWQKDTGFLSCLSQIPSTPTRVGLTRQRVHSQSSRAVSFILLSKTRISSSMGMGMDLIVPLIRGSS